MYLYKQSNIQCVSQTEGCTNSKETVITDTKLGNIFYNVLQNLSVINVHEVSYVVHMKKVHIVVLMIFSVAIAQWNTITGKRIKKGCCTNKYSKTVVNTWIIHGFSKPKIIFHLSKELRVSISHLSSVWPQICASDNQWILWRPNYKPLQEITFHIGGSVRLSWSECGPESCLQLRNLDRILLQPRARNVGIAKAIF